MASQRGARPADHPISSEDLEISVKISNQLYEISRSVIPLARPTSIATYVVFEMWSSVLPMLQHFLVIGSEASFLVCSMARIFYNYNYQRFHRRSQGRRYVCGMGQ